MVSYLNKFLVKIWLFMKVTYNPATHITTTIFWSTNTLLSSPTALIGFALESLKQRPPTRITTWTFTRELISNGFPHIASCNLQLCRKEVCNMEFSRVTLLWRHSSSSASFSHCTQFQYKVLMFWLITVTDNNNVCHANRNHESEKPYHELQCMVPMGIHTLKKKNTHAILG